ncbi:hypothetical protein BDV93DRAFT_527048 [Ceratobasidium sp. AG-I]|nr:hypothetical protein BDV93DRAFT_527048 [Ceratobasidium sp. AG-I]
MIALSPQFTSLLVALTVSTVGAVPTPISFAKHDARIVLGIDLPPVDVHANLRARSVASALHHTRKDEDTVPVYVVPRSHQASVRPASSHSRRGLGGPIDELDDISADEAGYSVSRFEGVGKRSIYKVHSEYGPGLIIAPLNTHQFNALAARGLLDSLLPLLGSLPGVGGIITLIGGTLKSVLGGLPIVGPILGNLLLAVHPGAQSVDGVNGAQFFLDASSSTNATTMYMVDSGRPSQLAMSSSDSNSPSNSTTNAERLVSLQMAFINSTSGAVQAFCATYDSTGALAAQPCLKDGVKEGPDASQAFGYNPSNGAVRPMWSGDKKGKRDYVVQTSEHGQEKEGDESVVLVFKPFEVEAGAGSNSTAPDAAPSTSSSAAVDPAGEGKDGDVDPADDAEPEEEDAAAAAQGVPVYVAAGALST